MAKSLAISMNNKTDIGHPCLMDLDISNDSVY